MNIVQVGQRIIEVNGQSLLGATHAEAVNILRNAGNTIKLLVCDGFNPSPPSDNPGENNEGFLLWQTFLLM